MSEQSEQEPAFGPRDHIVVQDLIKRFGKTEVLRGISLRIGRGETAVVIGGSGAGKTTLLRILIGLEKPTSGHVYIDGQDIVPLGDLAMNKVRQKFGMVFQYSALLDSLTVMDNVAFPLREHTNLKPRRSGRRCSPRSRCWGSSATTPTSSRRSCRVACASAWGLRAR